MSEEQFCTIEGPQLFVTSVSKKNWTNYSTVSLLWFVQIFLKQTLFEVVTCRKCRLRSKKVILEVDISNLQKLQGFAQSWGPCMPI